MRFSPTRLLLLFVMLTAAVTTAQGQAVTLKYVRRDTAYVRDFHKHYLIVRAYESTKFINYKFRDNGDNVIYKPNSHNNLGMGVTYRSVSVNLGFYVPLINSNTDKYGTTHYLDLQSHLFLRKVSIDFYGQFYRGYYLSNPVTAIAGYPGSGGTIPLRPDIRTNDISVVVQYVVNYTQFSYNAAFHQDEYQKKSAGSPIFGAGIYHVGVKGDSALIPSNVKYVDFYHNSRFNITSNNSISINAGYAYTYVYKKHFFVTGSLSAGVGINYATITDEIHHQEENKLGPEYNLIARFAAGYNSNLYFAGVTYVGLITEENSVFPETWQEVNTGNIRFTVAKRFRLKKQLIPKNDVIKLE